MCSWTGIQNTPAETMKPAVLNKTDEENKDENENIAKDTCDVM
jgi:hypothetical protein